MLTLLQFPPVFGLPNASPASLKLETFLRLAGLAGATACPLAARAGVVAAEEDGLTMADAAYAIDHLRQARGIDLDTGLSPAEQATARALGLMLEEHYYPALLYSRWLDDDSWPAVRQTVLPQLPGALRDAVVDRLREDVRSRLRAQGLGLQPRDRIYAEGAADLEALADFLGDKPFVMGRTPTGVDATAFALVAATLLPPPDGPLRRAAERHANLGRYVDRLLARCFAVAMAA